MRKEAVETRSKGLALTESVETVAGRWLAMVCSTFEI